MAPGSISIFVLPGEQVPAAWEPVGTRVHLGDVADRAAVRRAVAGHDCVIHLAACVSYCRIDRGRLTATNRDGVRNVVEACLEFRVERLVHVSSVGALGCSRDGSTVDETTVFNWPAGFHYMESKHEGQKVVEEAVARDGLRAVILNPAAIMGPGDPYPGSAYNQLMRTVYRAPVLPAFTGGQAVVDVRDVAEIVVKSLTSPTAQGPYVLASANLRYPEILKAILKHAGRRVPIVPVPAPLLASAGWAIEGLNRAVGRRSLLTHAYGRMSGWETYYANERGRQEFNHEYIDFDKTIEDGCRYFEATFLKDSHS